ncbi:PEP-CTERM sorting domain-containing protein [Desulfovibrio sp. X2]|uniref:PEP-CTERM sorting domain-containing protein n=1 Tax=Desulfovibrio sp. X2 TaxID=941449 RepID=UPI00155AE274|nr:PEP-CTERM sorting domain-containing protein [Desulfovibrio sp. X2]
MVPTLSINALYWYDIKASQKGFYFPDGWFDQPLIATPNIGLAGLIQFEGLYNYDGPWTPGGRYTIAAPGSSYARNVMWLIFKQVNPAEYDGYNTDFLALFYYMGMGEAVEPLYGPADFTAGQYYSLRINGVDVNFVTAAATPEPCTLLLTGLGLAGAAAWRRKRPRRAA